MNGFNFETIITQDQPSGGLAERWLKD